jgi:signal transduction histidine kinase
MRSRVALASLSTHGKGDAGGREHQRLGGRAAARLRNVGERSTAAVAPRDSGCSGDYRCRAMATRAAVEELLHRINNLLGTIRLQSEVAKTLGTPAAYAEALRLIVESSARTDETVSRLRASLGDAAGA